MTSKTPDTGPAPRPTTHEVQPLPTFTPRGLTPLQHRFKDEYLVDLNGVQAYMRASPKVTYETAATESRRLLMDPRISSEIQRAMDERSAITGITADRVLLRLWEIATADARKLTEYRIGSCRHCWGLYNQYQYTDAELSAAQDKHIREEAARRKKEGGDFEPREFPEKGGPGFDPSRPPNPECPECWGDGSGRALLHDTRHLGPGEAALFSGLQVKRDRWGNETVNIQMEDRLGYIQLVGRHLGMWNDKVKIEGEENPLMALIKQINEEHSTLPIIREDPERRIPSADVEDVEAKPVDTAPGAGFPMKRKQKWRAV